MGAGQVQTRRAMASTAVSSWTSTSSVRSAAIWESSSPDSAPRSSVKVDARRPGSQGSSARLARRRAAAKRPPGRSPRYRESFAGRSTCGRTRISSSARTMPAGSPSKVWPTKRLAVRESKSLKRARGNAARRAAPGDAGSVPPAKSSAIPARNACGAPVPQGAGLLPAHGGGESGDDPQAGERNLSHGATSSVRSQRSIAAWSARCCGCVSELSCYAAIGLAPPERIVGWPCRKAIMIGRVFLLCPVTSYTWARYKLVTSDRFRVNTGTHLGLNFRTSVLPVNGDSVEVNVARRYLAGELSPTYLLTKNISVGIYYLYSHGIDPGTINNTHFLTLNTNFSNIKLSNQFFLKVNPQFYYLKLDKQDGFYFTSSITIAKKNFPLSVSAIINKEIKSTITGSKNLIWNTSLAYSFNKKYSRI